MGKSTTARLCRQFNIPVFDADRKAHELTQPNSPVLTKIEAAFPGVVNAGVLDRAALGNRVFSDPKARTHLEALLHPEIHKARKQFIKYQRRQGRKLVILDIPLLFEKRLSRICDAIIVVSCSPYLQTRRVLPRFGMTHAKLNAIRSQQLSVAFKQNQATYCVYSGLGLNPVAQELKKIIKKELSNGTPYRT